MPDRVITNNISFLKAPKGGSAFVVDLDNEMTGIVVSEDGKTKSAVSLHPLVRAYYGTQSVIANCTVTVSSSSANVAAVYNTTTHYVDVSISSGVTLSDLTTITITVAHATYGTRVVYFTISATREGTDATLQELLPSLSEISFARQADKSLTPSSRNLTLSFKKTKGATVTIQTITDAGLTIRWSADTMPTTTSEGSNWGLNPSTPPTGITWNNITMQIANTVTASNIYIACFNSSGTLVDRETIPIIKDGQHGDDGDDGEDAAIAFASPPVKTIQCDTSGNVLSSQIQQVSFSMRVGTHNANVTGYTSPSSLPTGVSTRSLYTNVCEITVGTTATASGIANGLTFTVTGTYNGKTYSAKVTVALLGSLQGQQGQRGKVGRFYYYAGDFDVADTTTTFVVNDSQVPFFAYNDQYWVYNPETTPSGGTATMAQMGTPSSSSANWEIMTDDFKYLITEAIFGDYAHFGSAIINGDFMMSQLGYIRGFNGFTQDISSDTTYYRNFNPNEPFGTEEIDIYNAGNADKWLFGDGSLHDTIGTSWTQLTPQTGSGTFTLKSGMWYTFEVDGYCYNGGTLEIKIATASGATALASLSINKYTNDDTFYPAYITFKATATATGCKIFAKQTDISAIKGIYLREAQFVPNFVVDLHSGEMAANKLNGRLRAQYFEYDAEMSPDGRNIIVGTSSFACLSQDTTYCKVILPSPSISKGRVVEIFNASSSWKYVWEGATISDYFSYATLSYHGEYYDSGPRADGGGSQSWFGNDITYVKLWCDGEIWWILQEDHISDLIDKAIASMTSSQANKLRNKLGI